MLSMFTNLGGEGGCDPHKLSSEGTRAPHNEDIFEGGEDEEFLDVEDHEDDETHSKSDLRKSSKPVMEKKRRARINHCLSELKTLIVDALNRDPSRHNKLEKADILELTVRHLQEVQKRQLGVAVARDPSVLQRFRGGFAECAQEVNRYVTRIDSVDGGVKQRLVNHLGQCVTGLRGMTPAGFAAMAGVPLLPPPPPTSTNPPPMRPQYRPPQPSFPVPAGIEEASGSHARALQNLLLARMAPHPPPPSAVSSHPHQTQPPASAMLTVKRSPHSPPSQAFHGPTHATPNVSPVSGSVHTGSQPATPQSAKTSHSSSSSSLESSPESASQSPLMHYQVRPAVGLSENRNQSVSLSTIPLQPSLRIKKEEPALGQLFQSNHRVSAFTAVKSSSSTSSSSTVYPSSVVPSSQLRQNLAVPAPDHSTRSTSTLFDKVVAPTARRPIPNTVHESLIHGIESKPQDQKSSNLTFNATKSIQINGVNSFAQQRQGSSLHRQAENKDSNCNNSYFNPVVSRKRSLDSVYDHEVKHKIAKVEVVKGGPASLPVAGGVPPHQHLVRAPHHPEQQAPPIDEKDMWRPW